MKIPLRPVMNVDDALDALEEHASGGDFSARWRSFVRSCAALLLPSLPGEALAWERAADDYEAELLGVEQLTDVRVEAWRFFDARRATFSPREFSGLRVAMYRLWPADSPDRWHESATHFLSFCTGAGIADDELYAQLRLHFSDVLQPGRSDAL